MVATAYGLAAVAAGGPTQIGAARRFAGLVTRLTGTDPAGP